MDVFRRLDDATIVSEPFPYLILEDALDSNLCDALIHEMPPLDVLTRGAPPETNKRFTLNHAEVFGDSRISETWKQVLCQGLSQTFLDRVLRLFSSHIRQEFADFEEQFGAIDKMQAMPRQVVGRPATTIGMDAQLAVNTPALTEGTTVRGPHLDRLDKLFIGLLYLRPDYDDSAGGEFELYVPDCEKLTFRPKRMLSRDRVRLVSTIPYRRNTLVMFLNTPRSLHGVSPRDITPYPRYFINLVGETTRPLYHVDVQEPSTATNVKLTSGKKNWLEKMKGVFCRRAA